MSGIQMKILHILVLLIFASALFAVAFNFYNHTPLLEQRIITVGTSTLIVRIADTPAQHSRGLSNESKLEDNTGMLFEFKQSKPHLFWNKNTLLDLDVIWITNERVVRIDFLPAENKHGIVKISSPGPVDVVIETPAGWASQNNVSIGDLIIY